MVINAGETVAIFTNVVGGGAGVQACVHCTRATQMPLFYADMQAARFCLCLLAVIVITKPLSVVYESVRSAPPRTHPPTHPLQPIPVLEYQAEMHQMNNESGVTETSNIMRNTK